MTGDIGTFSGGVGNNDLGTADRTTLSALWVTTHGVAPPKSLSLSFLRQALAYELQRKAQGGLSGKLRRQIQQRGAQLAVRDAGTDGGAVGIAPGVTTLRPGARLIRDWNGKTWVVDVTAQGFVMQGQSYASLSAIAKKITGAHWSGPRFFGVKAALKPPSKPIKRQTAS